MILQNACSPAAMIMSLNLSMPPNYWARLKGCFPDPQKIFHFFLNFWYLPSLNQPTDKMKTITQASLMAGLVLCSCAEKDSGKTTADYPSPGYRPNILWLTCEDITPTLGCYGDSVVSTPNIDRLASMGIRYTNAYSVAGVCAPSRHGLITGMYPISTGGHNMRTINSMAPDVPNYSTVLPEEVRCFSEWLRAAGYYCSNNHKTDYQFIAPVTAWDECDLDAHWRKRPAGKPFFSIFNFITTHESRLWTKNDEPLLVDESAIVIPPYLPEHPKVRRDVARKYSNITEMDRLVGLLLDQLEADGLMDSTIIFFFSDHGGMLPREKRELYDTGLKVPLIVAFPGKSDDGQVDDQLVSFVDFGATVLSLAGVPVPEYIQGQAFLGEQKAAEERKYIFGARDRMDSEYDRARAVRDKRYKYIRNYYPDLPYVQNIEYRKQIPTMKVLYEYEAAGKLEGVQKLWWRNTKDAEELFDTWEDPYEFRNLAADPAHASKLQEMRNAMDEWLNTVGDKGAIPEVELVKQMWGGDVQPVTAEVLVSEENGRVKLECPTPGASIAWRYKNEGNPDQWFLYTGPFIPETSKTIEFLAHRIGFKPSDTKTYVPR
jgi:arylsulfatase A-like enzyme